MTDHPSPEQEAARIAGELESIAEACPSNPCLRSCNLCPDCQTKLEEAIAAALAAKETEIVALRDNNERVKELFDQRAVALTQARARVVQLEGFLVELRDYSASRVAEALRATSPEEPHQ